MGCFSIFRDELTQARATHNSYIAMSSDYNHQLADNKQEGLVLHIREQVLSAIIYVCYKCTNIYIWNTY